MTDHSHIDDQFRQSQGDWEGKPSDAIWDRMTDRLDEFNSGKTRKRKTIFRIAVAASLTILLGLSFAMFNQSIDVAGFHAINADQEIPPHESVFSPATTTEYEEGPALTSRNNNSIDVNTERPATRSSSRNTTPPPQVAEIIDLNDLPGQHEAEISSEGIHADHSTIDESISSSNGDDQASGNTAGYIVEEMDEVEMDAGPAYAEEEEIMEPEMLTESAVANAIGIEQTKASHKKREKSRTSAQKYMAPAEVYESKGDRTEGFVRKSLIVLIPNEEETRCTYTALLAEGDRFYIDRCQSDAFDLVLNESLPLDQNILLKLLEGDVETIQQIEKENTLRNCSNDVPNMQFIYRYGTDLSYFDETISWSSDIECLTQEARDIVERMIELVKTLD